MKPTELMEVERRVIAGWCWLGVGYVRIYPPGCYYTIWLLFLTNYIAVGIHTSIVKTSIRKEGGQ